MVGWLIPLGSKTVSIPSWHPLLGLKDISMTLMSMFQATLMLLLFASKAQGDSRQYWLQNWIDMGRCFVSMSKGRWLGCTCSLSLWDTNSSVGSWNASALPYLHFVAFCNTLHICDVRFIFPLDANVIRLGSDAIVLFAPSAKIN